MGVGVAIRFALNRRRRQLRQTKPRPVKCRPSVPTSLSHFALLMPLLPIQLRYDDTEGPGRHGMSWFHKTKEGET